MREEIQATSSESTAIKAECLVDEASLVAALSRPNNYPCDICQSIEQLETHISRVFLTEQFAYKIKKPVRNAFLDYSSLEKRRKCCLEELRLDGRCAPELYVGVVPITYDGRSIHMEGTGEAIEYAVKMKRFDQGALLSEHLASQSVTIDEIQSIATTLAGLHSEAKHAEPNSNFGDASCIRADAFENLTELEAAASHYGFGGQLASLSSWTRSEATRLDSLFDQRKLLGFIKECHGDLHSGNIVFWKGQWTPFDGVEFNQRFRTIDVLSDAGFLAMDLVAKNHSPLSKLFVNFYLEATGDYESLDLLRWYMVYRALVRAKVALIRAEQCQKSGENSDIAITELHKLLAIAADLTRKCSPCLWITHGLSGSGKSTGALHWVREHGAIRIRSDVERKRMLGMQAVSRPSAEETASLYAEPAKRNVYQRLSILAGRVLDAGFSPVVDATFLAKRDRDAFAELAKLHRAEFKILDFRVPESVLRSRVITRRLEQTDASDAGVEVLSRQIACQEPLSDSERECTIEVVDSFER